MGLFSSKRKVKVYSDVYNLAGDIHKRPNFLKTLVFDQTMYQPYPSMGQAINQSYVNGIGIKLRQVIRKANSLDFYNLVGQSQATIQSKGNIDPNALRDALNFRLGISASVYEYEMGAPELIWWGLQYLLDHLPERANEIFDVSINEDGTSMQIDFYETDEALEPYESLEFPSDPSVVDNNADYLFILYGVQAVPGLIEEEDIPTHEVDDFTAVVGFGDPVEEETKDVTYEWNEVVKVRDVYPDYEDVQEFVLPKSDTRENIIKTYNKVVDTPASETSTVSTRTDETYITTEGFKLVPEVTETVEEFEGFTRYTTTTDYRVEPAKFLQYNRKLFELFRVNDQKVFIHKRGDDPIFDALFSEATASGQFFPIIPVRYDRKPGTNPKPIFISDSTNPIDQEIYDKGKKILAKAGTRKSYDDIVKNLKKNNDVKNINYIYVMYGSSLNTPANSAKKYIYNFFKTFGDYSPETANEFNSYLDAQQVAEESREAWIEWVEAQKDPDNPLYATPEPVIIPYPRIPLREITIRSTAKLNLNYKISWSYIHSETGSGVLEGMTPGSVVIEKTNSPLPNELTTIEIINNTHKQVKVSNPHGTSIKLKYQKDSDNWEILTVYGLSSKNIIHRGKSITIRAHAALDDKDESGFIIPIHEIPFKNMSLVDSTQFGSSSMYLLLNYYSDTKQKWYQTDWFKIIITILIIVIVIIFPPAGLAGAASIGAAVAAAVGLTGVAALVFAAAVNAIVGIIVSRIISEAATKLLGDEIGLIVAAIVSMVAITTMNSYFAGQPVNLLEAFNSVNLVKLAGTISTDLAKYYQQQLETIQSEAQKYAEDFQKQSDYLNSLYANEYSNRAAINPTEFYQRILDSVIINESPDQFFARTLMTGSEVSNISLNAFREVINLDNSLMLM